MNEQSPKEKLRILVVDDKFIIKDVFDLTLGKLGHHITWIDNAKEALEVVKGDFDIVFLDIIMPDSDGVSLLEKIKKVNPEVPVVMMSGYSVEEKRQKIRELGVALCLDKPFSLEEVRQIIKEAIGKDV
jgi:CheY-like chemotaxis protein